ncbi:MAG: branched-chain amino acid ABC transporter permease [Acutalibacteraceae bacterium]
MEKTKRFRASTKKKIGILAGLLIVFAVVQLMMSMGMIQSHMQGLLVQICYNVILAVSLNLTVGVLGELSLGHAGFMCVGAFVGAFFSVFTKDMIPDWYIRFPLALILGGLVAALFGLLIGIPVLRLRGDYLAIVTLAFGEIIWNLCSVLYIATDANGFHFQIGGTGIEGLDAASATQIANGAQGIANIPRLPQQYQTMFIIGFVLVFLTVWATLNLIHSRTGRAIKSIRDNRIAAESVGISTTKYKLITLVISAFFAGIAGVLYSQNAGVAFPSQADYGYVMSIQILVFVVLGGMGSTLGSIIAAIALTVLPEWLRFLKDYRMLIYAVVLIVVMLLNNSPAFKNMIDAFKARFKKPVKPSRKEAK